MEFTTHESAHRRVLGVVALLAATIALVGVGASATSAAPGHRSQVQRSCSVDLGTGSVVCVDRWQDLNAAVLKQAHLRVVVPSGALGVTPSPQTAPASTQAVYIQTQLYSYPNYGGSMFQVTNSSDCNGTTVYQLTNLANYGFDNDTDSLRSFGHCSTKLWDGPNLTGISYGYVVNSTYVGDAMVNRASSLQTR